MTAHADTESLFRVQVLEMVVKDVTVAAMDKAEAYRLAAPPAGQPYGPPASSPVVLDGVRVVYRHAFGPGAPR